MAIYVVTVLTFAGPREYRILATNESHAARIYARRGQVIGVRAE